MRTQRKQPKERLSKKMKSNPEKMIEYIRALEAANKQLVISLKRCLKEG